MCEPVNQFDQEIYSKVAELSKELAESREDRNEQEHAESVNGKRQDQTVLFVSYDIVNSTKYKTLNPDWFDVNRTILKEIIIGINELRLNNKNIHFWKFLGDELLFFIPIEEGKSLPDLVKSLYEILQNVCDFIHAKDKAGKDILKAPKKDILSLKATAWLATVTKYDSRNEKIRNSEIENLWMKMGMDSYSSFEFMGPDIDTGFRIAKETNARQLTLSYELAYLVLSQKGDSNKNSFKIHLKSFVKLKGVWDDMDYPVLWYFTKTERHKTIEDTINPSLFFTDSSYENLQKRKNKNKDIKKILKNLMKTGKPGLKDKIDQNMLYMRKNVLFKEEINTNESPADWSMFGN